MKSGKIDSNGQKLFYEVHGEAYPLVLIMGIGYDATLWDLIKSPHFRKNIR